MSIHLPHRRIGTGKTPKELDQLVSKYERDLAAVQKNFEFLERYLNTPVVVSNQPRASPAEIDPPPLNLDNIAAIVSSVGGAPSILTGNSDDCTITPTTLLTLSADESFGGLAYDPINDYFIYLRYDSPGNDSDVYTVHPNGQCHTFRVRVTNNAGDRTYEARYDSIHQRLFVMKGMVPADKGIVMVTPSEPDWIQTLILFDTHIGVTLALDIVEKLIYYADDSAMEVYRVTYSGLSDTKICTSTQVTAAGIASGTIVGLELDPSSGTLYATTDVGELFSINASTGACTLLILATEWDGVANMGANLAQIQLRGSNLMVNAGYDTFVDKYVYRVPIGDETSNIECFQTASAGTSIVWDICPFASERIPSTTALIYDTFTDSNDTLLRVHTPDINLPNNAWIHRVGDWEIQSNQADRSSTGTQEYASIDSGVSDVHVRADITLSATRSIGIILRDNGNTYWLVEHANVGGTMRIFEYDGTFTVRASTAITVSAASTYTFKATAVGSLIVATVEDDVGIKQIYWEAATMNQTATSHGIREDGSSACTFDNFYIYEL